MRRHALLVIDMQCALVSGAYQEDEVLDNINRVIEKFRAIEQPVIFIQHNHNSFAAMKKGAQGWQIHPALDKRAQDLVIQKKASDAFFETDLYQQLSALSVTELVITGMQTEFCVDATCRAALSHRFDVHLVADAHTTGPSHLPAATIIDHHNKILVNLAHPSSRLKLVSSADLDLT